MHFQASNCMAFPAWKALKRLIWTNDLYLKFRTIEPLNSLMIYPFFFSALFCPSKFAKQLTMQHHKHMSLSEKENRPCCFAISRSNKRVTNDFEHCSTGKNNSRLTSTTIWTRGNTTLVEEDFLR